MPPRRTKILFIITQSEMGGAQRFILELASSLNPKRFKSTILTGPDGDGGLHAQASRRTTNSEGTRIHTGIIPNLTRSVLPWRWWKALHSIRRMVRHYNPHIVFLNSSAAGFVGSWALRNTNIPIIYRIGGWSFNDPRPRWQKLVFYLSERLSAHWKNVIVVNSERDRQQVLGRFKPRKGIVTIGNGLDADDINFIPRERARQRLSELTGMELTDDTFLFGNVANFYPSKGHGTLLRAFEIFRHNNKGAQSAKRSPVPGIYKRNSGNCEIEHQKLILIGDGFLRPKIGETITELGLENDVFLAGRITNARRYLKALDAFVLSSQKEGFPWTILEAAAAGAPIIATDVSGVPDFVKNPDSGNQNKKIPGISTSATGLLVPPSDPDALANAMEKIVVDADLRNRLVQGASQMLRKNFSKEKMVATYERLFKKLN